MYSRPYFIEVGLGFDVELVLWGLAFPESQENGRKDCEDATIDIAGVGGRVRLREYHGSCRRHDGKDEKDEKDKSNHPFNMVGTYSTYRAKAN